MIRGRSLQSRNPPGPPGQRLKALREALGISGRDVQTHSRLIARSQGNQRYCISHSSLVEIENSTRELCAQCEEFVDTRDPDIVSPTVLWSRSRTPPGSRVSTNSSH